MKMARSMQGFVSFENTTRWSLKTVMGTFGNLTLKFVWLFSLVVSPAAFAQFNAGVQGSVQDSTGASIAGATITLTNADNKVTQATQSDAGGVFRFASLGPGNYTVSATAKGFSTAQTEIVLNAGETRDVPLTVSVGQVATSVTVTTQAALLDTSDSRNQQTLDTVALQNLPLAARNPTALLELDHAVIL